MIWKPLLLWLANRLPEKDRQNFQTLRILAARQMPMEIQKIGRFGLDRIY